MKNWGGKDYPSFVASIVLTYGITRGIILLCGTWMLPALFCMALFALIPCLCGAAFVYVLKKRQKGIWLCVAVAAVLDSMFILMSFHFTTATKLRSCLIGHYNLEATGFFLLFAILFCSGLLLGYGLGYMLSRRKVLPDAA